MRFNGCDGSGFDVDYDQDGTVVQFNYSHDNEGGFILLCTDAKPRTAQVRFNLSVDDRLVANQSPCSLAARARPTRGSASTTTRSSAPALLGRARQPHHARCSIRPGSRCATTSSTPPRRRPTTLGCGAPCSHNLFFGLPAGGRGRGERRSAVPGPGAPRPWPDRRGPRLPAAPPGPRPRGAGTSRSRARPARDYFGRPVPVPPADRLLTAVAPAAAGNPGFGRQAGARRHGFGAPKVCVISRRRRAAPPQGEQSAARATKGRHPWRCLLTGHR